MKWKALLKTVPLVFVAGIPLVATSIFATSCSDVKIATPPPDKPYSFSDFKTAAQNEKAINIVNHATVKAKGWNHLVNSDLSKSKWKVNDNNVTITITSHSLLFSAQFSATYTADQSYQVSDWWCSQQPKSLTTFAAFAQAAKAATAKMIVNNAIIQAKGWDDLPAKDLTKWFVSATKNQVIYKITSASKMEIAQFVAIYVTGEVYQLSDWVCNTQPKPAPTFADFTKAAKNETALNIIKNATPKPIGWDHLVESDLTKKLISITNNRVIYKITSVSKNQGAQFSAAYIQNQPYQLSDWKCSAQPKVLPTFSDFIKLAKAETATNIVKNAKVKAKGWDALPKGDLSKKFISATNNQVIFDISSKSKTEVATFSATYIKHESYQVSDWTCSSQSVYDWEVNTTKLLEDKIPEQDKGEYNFNMMTKIMYILRNKPPSTLNHLHKFIYHYNFPKDYFNVLVDENSLTYTSRGGSKKLGEITFKLSFYLKSDKTEKLLTSGGLFSVSKEFADDPGDSYFDSMKILKDIN